MEAILTSIAPALGWPLNSRRIPGAVSSKERGVDAAAARRGRGFEPADSRNLIVN